MIFQAWRSLLPSTSCKDMVPCAPVRSSFSAALADTKHFKELGFVSAVRVISPVNQL